MSGYRRGRWAAALVGSVLAPVLFIRARHVRPQPERPYGRFTAQQILCRSEPLCCVLVPRSPAFNLAVAPTRVHTAPFWTVLCTDPIGREVANLCWDANTGELAQVSAMPPKDEDGRPMSLLSRSAAVAKARVWMAALGFCARSSHWQV